MLLAAGIAGEVLVWPLIAVVSSVQHRDNPFAAGVRATVLAAGFFAFMLTLGTALHLLGDAARRGCDQHSEWRAVAGAGAAGSVGCSHRRVGVASAAGRLCVRRAAEQGAARDDRAEGADPGADDCAVRADLLRSGGDAGEPVSTCAAWIR